MKKLLALVAVVLGGVFAFGWFGLQSGYADDDDELVFEAANLFIEFNDTDQDVGVQVMVNGEPYKRLKLFSPDGRKLLDIGTQRSLRQQGLSELFFESAEPTLDDVSLEEFLERFPEGEYEFEGRTIDGVEIEGEATFTHVIPAGPVITFPDASSDELTVVDPGNFVVEWQSVTDTIAGSADDLEIVSYEVVVTQEDPLRVISILLPPSATSVTIPPEFFAQPDTVHALEILAKEVSGNQTITSVEFVTAP